MKKKVLFIDRDGSIIIEPPGTYQIDRLDLLEFLPGVIRYLYRIRTEFDYEFVMVTNQDGLGGDQYPEAHFQVVQDKMMLILGNEGIAFDQVHVDRSFAHENKPTRKPGTGLLTHFFSDEYDLANSYVIGDRITDVQLAANLGCQAIFIRNNDDPAVTSLPIALVCDEWKEIYDFLHRINREAEVKRKTNETDICVKLNLDGTGKYKIETGLGFFDHMLEQLARHSGIDLEIKVKGDLHIDEHHTIEDTAIALGAAFRDAIGDKKGIERYGFYLPMDDCIASVAVDFGGRNWLVWEAEFNREKIGDMPTEMFFHFFKSFSDASQSNIHIKAEGVNEHHKIESIFKALARAVKMAIRREPGNRSLPSTKGIL